MALIWFIVAPLSLAIVAFWGAAMAQTAKTRFGKDYGPLILMAIAGFIVFGGTVSVLMHA